MFESANKEWLHCIVGHRKKNTFNHVVSELAGYDLVRDKIANDSTNTTINAYMAEIFENIGSDRADEICIELLLPNRLEVQFCFRRARTLKCLEFIGSDKAWMKK